MKLYLLRHANAAERNAGEYPDDSLRPLTSAGCRKMTRIARALEKMDLKVDLILSSPFLRARETAEIARKTLQLDRDQLVLTDRLLPSGSAKRLIEEIRGKYPLDNLLLVGHEPDLSELVSLLLMGEPSPLITLKKGGICCLSVDELVAGKCATLEWLINPAQLGPQ
ncbi:MAG TPA: phosphohistidine phosphatase SixA [Anaerolineales bacterium]|nr:phosphohistidine phosphatase SixA [Anaerolineales bacterium]